MYSKDYSLHSVPEIVAHSGFVLLHFYSDIAYNLSGFNISYRYLKKLINLTCMPKIINLSSVNLFNNFHNIIT
jgi:hypothetical protein